MLNHDRRVRLFLGLGFLSILCGCSKQTETTDSSQIVFPPAEAVVLDLITPNPEAFGPAEPNQIVFDMQYRGLSGPDDPLFNRSYYGYGGDITDTPFIKDLKRYGIQNLHLTYNPEFRGAEVSAVEMADGKPVAFYMDLDANGKVTANERITPFTPREPEPHATYFLTPDCSFKNHNDQQTCFRAQLRVMMYEGQDTPNCNWTPCAVLVAETRMGDTPARLILFPNGLSGNFDKWGWTDASLQMGTEQMEKKPHRHDLSRLLSLNDRFYRLEIKRQTDKGTALRVLLTEDTSLTGQIKIQVATKDNLKSKIPWARIKGATQEAGISLALSMSSMTLPIGTYRLDRGQLNYGLESNEAWRVDFESGPEFTIAAGFEKQVDLGRPQLKIKAIDQKDRYRSKAKIQTTYKKGTTVYLDRLVTGSAGEVYGRFEEKIDSEKGRYREVPPHLTIHDPQGKQILSKDLEYG